MPYVDALIAANLANRLVYKEGVGFVAGTAEERLAGLALGYLDSQTQVIERFPDSFSLPFLVLSLPFTARHR